MLKLFSFQAMNAGSTAASARPGESALCLRRTLGLRYYQGMLIVRALVAAFILVSAAARADTLVYTIAGTYPTNAVTELDDNFNVLGQGAVPVTSAVSPGASYQLQFSLSTPLTPAFSNTAEWASKTLLTYSLNGSLVSSAQNTLVFFTGARGGFVFPEYALTIGQHQYYWSWAGPQLFAGPTSHPTLLTGTLATNGVSQGLPTLQFVGIDQTLWELPDNAVVTVSDSSAVTAEPPTEALLALAGLLCVAIGMAKRKPSLSEIN